MMPEAIDHEGLLVHNWRAARLKRLVGFHNPFAAFELRLYGQLATIMLPVHTR